MTEIIDFQGGKDKIHRLNKLERADMRLQNEKRQSRSRHPAFVELINEEVVVEPITMLPAEEFEPPTLTLVRNTSEPRTPPVNTVE